MVGSVTVTGGTDAPEQELAETGGPSLAMPTMLLLLAGSGFWDGPLCVAPLELPGR